MLGVELLSCYPVFALLDEFDPIEGILSGTWLFASELFILGLLLLILQFCLAYIEPNAVSIESWRLGNLPD